MVVALCCRGRVAVVRTDVSWSLADTYLEASAAMRVRFELRTVRAARWSEGLTAALDDLAERVNSDQDSARLIVVDRGFGDPAVLRMRERDRQLWVDAMVAAWCHHHDGTPPVFHLEFFCGAIRRVIASGLEARESGDLRARLLDLLAFVDDAVGS
jgi:hypothetical protein